MRDHLDRDVFYMMGILGIRRLDTVSKELQVKYSFYELYSTHIKARKLKKF